MLSNTLQPAVAEDRHRGRGRVLEWRMGHSHRVVRRLCSDKRAFCRITAALGSLAVFAV